MQYKKGSVTIEMAILFPFILYILFFILYIIILMYQQAYVKYICEDTLSKAGNWWTNYEKDFDSNLISIQAISNEELYDNLYDINEDYKLNYIRNYMGSKLNFGTILKPSEFDIQKNVKIKVARFILYKKLYLEVNIAYKLPVPSLVRFFNIKDTYAFKISSSAMIKDYSQYIYDINFISDIITESKDSSQTIKKIADALDEIKKKVLF